MESTPPPALIGLSMWIGHRLRVFLLPASFCEGQHCQYFLAPTPLIDSFYSFKWLPKVEDPDFFFFWGGGLDPIFRKAGPGLFMCRIRVPFFSFSRGLDPCTATPNPDPQLWLPGGRGHIKTGSKYCAVQIKRNLSCHL